MNSSRSSDECLDLRDGQPAQDGDALVLVDDGRFGCGRGCGSGCGSGCGCGPGAGLGTDSTDGMVVVDGALR